MNETIFFSISFTFSLLLKIKEERGSRGKEKETIKECRTRKKRNEGK